MEYANAIGFAVVSMFGLIFALFSRNVAHMTSEFYLNLLHVRFSENGYRMAFLLAGILLFVFGIVALFHTVA